MGQNSRTFGRRSPRHANLSARVNLLDESGLFELLEGRAGLPLVLILDGIQDPHNFGACLRSADGAGVTVVIVPKDRSVTVTDTVRTVACGGAESVPIAQVTNLARTMDQLKELGIWLVGTSDHAAQSIFEVDLTGPIGLVMGSEGKGVRRLTSEKCDFLCQIPMAGAVESLNVSVAAGVCLYEAVRQRKFKK